MSGKEGGPIQLLRYLEGDDPGIDIMPVEQIVVEALATNEFHHVGGQFGKDLVDLFFGDEFPGARRNPDDPDAGVAGQGIDRRLGALERAGVDVDAAAQPGERLRQLEHVDDLATGVGPTELWDRVHVAVRAEHADALGSVSRAHSRPRRSRGSR